MPQGAERRANMVPNTNEQLISLARENERLRIENEALKSRIALLKNAIKALKQRIAELQSSR